MKNLGNVRAIRWDSEHKPYCSVTAERANLLRDLLADPSAEELWGAVTEYMKEGDQETENCDCGEVDHRRVTIVLPWDLTRDMLVPEPGAMGYDTKLALRELGAYHLGYTGYTRAEIQRILIGAVCLGHKTRGINGWTFTVGECIRTAMIWERG